MQSADQGGNSSINDAPGQAQEAQSVAYAAAEKSDTAAPMMLRGMVGEPAYSGSRTRYTNTYHSVGPTTTTFTHSRPGSNATDYQVLGSQPQTSAMGTGPSTTTTFPSGMATHTGFPTMPAMAGATTTTQQWTSTSNGPFVSTTVGSARPGNVMMMPGMPPMPSFNAMQPTTTYYESTQRYMPIGTQPVMGFPHSIQTLYDPKMVPAYVAPPQVSVTPAYAGKWAVGAPSATSMTRTTVNTTSVTMSGDRPAGFIEKF